MNNRNYIKVTKGKVDAKLDVFIYENDGFKIAYAPALDLMGYGKTIEDAKASFEIVAEDFFETTIQRGTLKQYLEEHGSGKGDILANQSAYYVLLLMCLALRRKEQSN